MKIAPGVQIGSFEVRAQIGAGGMGSVFSAYDTRLHRDVAIKVLHERASDREESLRRFEREARSASALNHPNIITIFEIDEFEGTPFIAMELVDGTSMREVLDAERLPLRRVLHIATQIADGLAAAHDRGIVHRDVKPENVMITKNGLVKILDFGLARTGQHVSVDDSTDELITRDRDGRVIGTAAYMSPEQAHGKPIDFRSDQFSFGAMLYEMATGKRAFRRGTVAETIHAILHEEPEPVHEINPDVPLPLCWIIERCLAKEAGDRYASTSDLARELHTVRERLAELSSPGRRLRRRPVMVSAWVTAAIAVVLTAGAMYQRFRDQTAVPANAPRFLAVLPFTSVSENENAQLFSRGLADAVSARLAKLGTLQVIPPTSTAPLVAKGADERRIAQELGANLLLNASVRQSGESVSIQYTIVDSARGSRVAHDTVSGPAANIWTLQEQLVTSVARRLGIESVATLPQRAELQTAEEQDLYLRALGHLQNYDDDRSLDKALGLLRELLETAPGSPLVHSALARTYVQKYLLTKDRAWSDKAIQAADRSRALAPDSSDVLFAQAQVQRFTGQYGDAIATFKRALSMQPNSPEAVLGLAASYQGARQIDDAERTFRRAISLRSTWWSPHNELGVLYLSRGRYDDAAREFKLVTQLNPQSPWGYSNLGIIALTNEKLDDAIAAFRKAISLREDAAAYANLAYCYYYLGDYDKSAEGYRKATNLRPKKATDWANLADACRWTTQCKAEADSANEHAIELLNQELAVDPLNSRAQATLAVCLAKLGRRDEAQEHIQKSLEIEPKNPARMFQAARVANFLGDTAGAVTWLRRAIDAGYGRFELERDPEFRTLRATDAFRSAFKKQAA